LIRQIDTSLTQALTPTKTTPDKAPPSGQFADQLKKAASTVSDDKPAAGGTTANRAQPATDETWRPVDGHDDYAKIITGDRKGQYVNLNRGGRKGEAFSIQEKDGDQYHVYKQDGKDDLWVKVDSSSGAKAATTPKNAPPKGETWGPVNGASSYADVLSGARDGYFVNISQGSKREGEAFHIIKKSGKEYHVYGSGDKKTWVEVGAKKATDTKGTSGTTSGDAASGSTGSTGSSAATDSSASTDSSATTKSTGKPIL
jgi:hypothetical protein